jgi:TonB family protein
MRDARLRRAIRRRRALLLGPILLAALFSTQAGAAAPQTSSSEVTEKGVPARSGRMPTRPGLQLTLRADCGKIQILTDGSDEVRYVVRSGPDSRINGAAALALRDLALTANSTPRGAVLTSRASTEADCRADLIYEIHVPHRYDLDVALQSGDIIAQEIDGLVVLSTGGGDIRAARVGAGSAGIKGSADLPFAARLATAGGNIFVGDVAGGLRASTGGGLISAGDVHGSAVLRTGGGDIRLGHVFGSIRLASAGGNITAKKVDGGVWADTVGGRVEIGDSVKSPAALQAYPEDPTQESDVDIRGILFEPRETIPALGDLVGFTDLARVLDAFLWGGIRVDPVEQQRRLLISVAPIYPDVAQLAGIEGDVTLRILVIRDGTVGDVSPIAGPPVLARAGMRAVEQWRYLPARVQGYPVDVLTTVTLAFRLR